MRSQRPSYVKPEIVTLDSDQILMLVGPAQGYGVTGGAGIESPDTLIGGTTGSSQVSRH